MAQLLGHRQTKETATDKPNLLLPRHIPTLPRSDVGRAMRLSLPPPWHGYAGKRDDKRNEADAPNHELVFFDCFGPRVPLNQEPK